MRRPTSGWIPERGPARELPHPAPRPGLRGAVRRHAQPGRLDSGRRRPRVRGDGVAAASRDDRDPRRERHDLRPHRRAARDRRAGNDRLRRPAQRRRAEEGRRQGGTGSRARPRRAVPEPRRPDEAVRVRRAQGRSGEGEGAPEARRGRDRLLPRGAAHATRRGGSPRSCSGSRVRTTGASTAWREPSIGLWQASPVTRSSSATRPARRSTSSRRGRSGRGRTSSSRSTTSCRRPPSSCSPPRCIAGRRKGRPRSSWTREPERSSRWQTRRRSTRTGSQPLPWRSDATAP